MPFLRVCLLGSTALATVGGAAALFAVASADTAEAACTLQSGLGETVTCLTPFDATLSFDPIDNELSLQQGFDTQTSITDLSGNDTILLSPGDPSEGINQLAVETLSTGPAAATERLDLRGGDDIVSVNTGRLIGTIIGGANDDEYTVLGDGIVFLDPTAAVLNGVAFSGEGGIDEVTIGTGVDLFFRLLGGSGPDIFDIDGTVGVPRNPNFDTTDPIGLDAGPGNDTIVLGPNTAIAGAVSGGSGNDTITAAGSAAPFDGSPISIAGGFGNDTITVQSGANILGVLGFDLEGGPIPPSEETDDDVIIIESGAVVDGTVRSGFGNDTITSAGVIVGSDIEGGGGNDVVVISGGQVEDVFGDDDTTSPASGPEGIDTLTFSGGEITSTIQGFEVLLADETLSPEPFTDFNFDVFGSALGSDITIANTNLRREEFSGLPDVFNIDSVTQTNSVVQIFDPQGVDRWFVTNGSQLFVQNDLDQGQTDFSVENSTLTLVDGDPTDVLTVNSLRMLNGTIAVDVSPGETEPVSPGLDVVLEGPVAASPGRAEQILPVSDTIQILNATENAFVGDNVVAVNFTAPVTETGLIIPIATIIDEPTPGASDSLANNFRAEILNPEIAPLVALSLLQGPQGGLFLRTEANAVVVTPPPVTNNTTTVFTTDAIRDVNADLIDNEIGFSIAGPTGPAQITPDFGVYANGSFGHIDHDGFDVTGPGGPDFTPSFTANNFSLIVTGEADATAALGVDNEDIGVKASIFGGYVNSDVTLDRAVPGGGFSPFEGSGTNNGGVLGATLLASRIVGEGDLNYGLLAAAGFLGNTEVVNANTGGEGDYDTQGFILSAKMGRNMAVRDRLRVDLRFGASYAAFYGDSFIDSSNVAFGDTSTRFGLLTFEPGVSTAFLVGERVVSPSARLLFHQRVGYTNEAEVSGANFDFDDGDFTFGAQVGANVRITERLSAGAFLEGRVTEDQRSALAKLAVKYVFSKN